MADVKEKDDEDKTPDITKLMQDRTILNPEQLPGDEEADQDDENDENKKEKALEEKEKRETKKSRACLSPYVRRQVVIHEPRKNHESKVATYIFTGYGEYDTAVFKMGGELSLTRVICESMRLGLDAHIRIIQCWAHILNYEERYKAPESPSRLFCTEIILVTLLLYLIDEIILGLCFVV
ncbi:hypothetical protein Hanom_Chr12g01114411 [Helianthus anomalus]